MMKNSSLGRAGALLALAVVAAVSACDDDAADQGGGGLIPDSGAPTLPDGSTALPDTGAPQDAGHETSDAGTKDATVADADADAEAGPTVTTSLGATGLIRLYNEAAFAEFFEDDSILRASNAPECVVHYRSRTKPRSVAGTLTIGGPVVGAAGGPAQSLTADPDPTSGNEYLIFDTVFPSNDDLQVTVEGPGTEVFPALPAQALRPPPAAPVTLTAPVLDAGALAVSSTQPLALTWTPPATAQPGAMMVVEFRDVKNPSTNGKTASLFCNYPLSTGAASVPANLLAAIKAVVGSGAKGNFAVFAGGGKEFTATGTSYVLSASRLDSRNIDVFDTPLE